jgi:hypothetical protein
MPACSLRRSSLALDGVHEHRHDHVSGVWDRAWRQLRFAGEKLSGDQEDQVKALRRDRYRLWWAWELKETLRACAAMFVDRAVTLARRAHRPVMFRTENLDAWAGRTPLHIEPYRGPDGEATLFTVTAERSVFAEATLEDVGHVAVVAKPRGPTPIETRRHEHRVDEQAVGRRRQSKRHSQRDANRGTASSAPGRRGRCSRYDHQHGLDHSHLERVVRSPHRAAEQRFHRERRPLRDVCG